MNAQSRCIRLLLISVLLPLTPLQAVIFTYSYDPLNRLTNAIYSDGATESYVYDDAGNRLSKLLVAAPPVPGDLQAPQLVITAPTNGAVFFTNLITVSGTATDAGQGDSGIGSVTVNRLPATGGTASGAATSQWSLVTTLLPGYNPLRVLAEDGSTNHNRATNELLVVRAIPSNEPPAIIASSVLPGGDFAATFVGNLGSTYDLWASTNLIDWVSVTNITLADWVQQLVDIDAYNFPYRFYRFSTPANQPPARFQWAVGAGGSSDDVANAVASGPGGTWCVTGTFQGTADFGSTNVVSTGQSDIFIAAYASDGELLWVTTAGGSGNDEPRGIVVDGNGNIYVTGMFRNTATFGSIAVTGSVNGAVFVAKYDSAGQCLWVHQAGSSLAASGDACTVDRNGDLLVAGHYYAASPFWDEYSLTNAGEYDVFLVKVAPDGHILWLNRLGGSSYYDFPYGVAVDTNLNVFVSGVIAESAFIAKYDGTGTQQWLTQTTAHGPWPSWSVAADNSGGVFFAGAYSGSAQIGAITITNAGGADCVLGHLDASGAPDWVENFGGTNDDGFNSIMTDETGHLLVTGSFQDSIQVGAAELASAGGRDVLIANFDSDGVTIWTEKAGGIGDDFGQQLAIGADGSVAVVGSFSDTSTFSSVPLLSHGSRDAFIVLVLP